MQNLIATKLGVQRITGITVFDITEAKSYDLLPDWEVCPFDQFSVCNGYAAVRISYDLVP